MKNSATSVALMVAMVSAITTLPDAEMNVGRADRDAGQNQQRDQRSQINRGFCFRIASVFGMCAHVIK